MQLVCAKEKLNSFVTSVGVWSYMFPPVLLRKAVLVLNLTLEQSHVSLLSTSSLETKGLPEPHSRPVWGNCV